MVNHLYKNTGVIAKSFSGAEAIFIGRNRVANNSGYSRGGAAEQYAFQKAGIADPKPVLLQKL